mgnify:CR=1 FL=1
MAFVVYFFGFAGKLCVDLRGLAVVCTGLVGGVAPRVELGWLAGKLRGLNWEGWLEVELGSVEGRVGGVYRAGWVQGYGMAREGWAGGCGGGVVHRHLAMLQVLRSLLP